MLQAFSLLMKSHTTAPLAGLLLLVITLLQACSSTQVSETPAITISYDHNGLFGAPPTIPSEEEVFRLTDEQQTHFLTFFNDPKNKDVLPYVRIFDYIERITYRFSYKSKTYSASDTLIREQGNCMSLAILTTALAQLADVDAGYQLIDSSPIFERTDDVIIKGVHVRTMLFRDPRGLDPQIWGSRGLIIDYFPSGSSRFLRNLRHEDFIARFYRNIAVERLQQGNYSDSYWYTRRSLDYSPMDYESINQMAVIFKKAGNLEKAEEIYLYGIETAQNKLTLLKNYHLLLEEQGRQSEAEKILAQIEKYDDQNPYNWLNIADVAFKEKKLYQALKYYKKSIALAPYLQYGYLGLAKTYYALGRHEKSKSMFIQAMEHNHDPANHRLYLAKLSALAKEKNWRLKILETQ